MGRRCGDKRSSLNEKLQDNPCKLFTAYTSYKVHGKVPSDRLRAFVEVEDGIDGWCMFRHTWREEVKHRRPLKKDRK